MERAQRVPRGRHNIRRDKRIALAIVLDVLVGHHEKCRRQRIGCGTGRCLREGQAVVRCRLPRRRIEQAKVLLKGTDRNVTTIAYETGFQDSNYFSTIFQKEVGVSPRGYRKEK